MRVLPAIRFSLWLATALVCASALTPASADTWTIQRITDGSVPPKILPELRRTSPGGLPHGLIATADGNSDIAAAWYAGPTRRYGHGILGDAVEAGVLKVRSADGREYSLTLPPSEVFEDRYPRLADLDGDGTTEIVTIRASLTLGAAVTVYGVRDGALGQLASTGFIGTANRWLNIAGIAAFRGRTGKEIAYVQTPHIGGTLYVYAFENGRLLRVGSLFGFSNHLIGSTEMRLSGVADIDGDGMPELALPSAVRDRLRIVGFKNGVTERASIPLPARIDKAIRVSGEGRHTRFVTGLDNGWIISVGRK